MAEATDVKIRITDDVLKEYKDQCTKWSPVYMRLPIAQAEDVLKFFTKIKNLRGKMRMPSIKGKSQFRPFDKRKKSDADVDIDYRTIETFHANVIETFAPVDYVDIPLGYDSQYLGEAMKKAPQSALIMAELSGARGEYIAQAAFTGKRNPEGTTTEDVCDGLITIAEAEIEDGNISVEKGNLYEMPKALTMENCCDEIKKFVFSMDPYLRKSENILFCSPEIEDMYNESYLMTHQSVPYNEKYEQPYVEGSNKKLTLVGLPQLAGCGVIFATCMQNLVFGTYLSKDKDSVDIMREGHYELSMCADMWMGFNFRTLDKRVIKFIKLNTEADVDSDKDSDKDSDNDNGDQGEQGEGGQQTD